MATKLSSTVLARLNDAMRLGNEWVGWGEEKGCALPVTLHRCGVHGEVTLCGIGEMNAWLGANVRGPSECYDEVLSRGLQVDQRVWSSAYAAARLADRAMAQAMSGNVREARDYGMRAAKLAHRVRDGFGPWDSLVRALYGL